MKEPEEIGGHGKMAKKGQDLFDIMDAALARQRLRQKEDRERAKETQSAREKADMPADKLPLYAIGPLSGVPMQNPIFEKSPYYSEQKPLGIKIWDFLGALKRFRLKHIKFGNEIPRDFIDNYIQGALDERANRGVPSMDPVNWRQRNLVARIDERGEVIFTDVPSYEMKHRVTLSDEGSVYNKLMNMQRNGLYGLAVQTALKQGLDDKAKEIALRGVNYYRSRGKLERVKALSNLVGREIIWELESELRYVEAVDLAQKVGLTEEALRLAKDGYKFYESQGRLGSAGNLALAIGDEEKFEYYAELAEENQNDI